MRTTLKRGIGRGAALNGHGNGRAVLPPTSPAFTVYRQPEPSSRSIAGLVLKGFLWLLAGIVSVFVSGSERMSMIVSDRELRSLSFPLRLS